MTTYDELLAEAKTRGQGTAKEYIPKLYDILVNEEGKDPYDARGIIEHDLVDTWSKSTIRQNLPEEVKNKDKVKAGEIGAEKKKVKIVLQNSGAEQNVSDEKGVNSGSSDGSNYQKENNSVPSFSTALDIKEEKEPIPAGYVNEPDTLQKTIEFKDAEIQRLEEINKNFRIELEGLREAVTKTSFKPATEVKSFTFNDLPNPDNSNSFIWKKIKLDKFRMELGPIKAAGDTYFNVYLERTK